MIPVLQSNFCCNAALHANNIFALLLIVVFASLTRPALAHGDLEIQIDELSIAIEKKSGDAFLFFQRAELYRRILAWDAAKNDYARAEKLGYSKTELDYYRGRMFVQAGDDAKATQHLDKYIKNHPNDSRALTTRAKISTRPPLDAVDDLDKAIVFSDRPSPDMFLDRAKLTIKAGPKYFDRMIAGLEQAIAHFGPLVSLLEFGVTESETTSNWQLAIKLANKLPEQIKGSPRWMYRIGLMHINLQNHDQAHHHFEKALLGINELSNARKNTPATRKLLSEIKTSQEVLMSSTQP